MDNTVFYKPFWKEKVLAADHENNIDKLHVTLMNMLLPETSAETPPPPTIEKVISTSTHLAQTLLSDLSNENEILQKVRTSSARLKVEPIHALKGAIVAWYSNCAEALSLEPWDFQMLHESDCPIGNLGYISMLRLKEVWDPPSHPRLRAAALMANAAVSFLFAALLIIPHLSRKKLRQNLARNDKKAMAMFLQTAWRVARESRNKAERPPAAEFGAMNTAVKLSKTGNQLLVHLDGDEWEEVPCWHPCRIVPGSAWNKFMRNRCQPVFPMGHEVLYPEVQFAVPSSAINLIDIYRDYYMSIRDQFDDSSVPRTKLSYNAQGRQFARLGKETGLRYYATAPLEEETWNVEDFVEAEHLYHTSLVNKPATDLSGNLTLPFLNTTAAALRHEHEFEFFEENFHTMVFGA
uniref:Mating type protein 1-1-2 n=1 Tax=Calonectria hongkongensis TaxID=306887 RepID=A0A7S6BF92_9HYPO|nr:mating type protein 1-1-2 [Calonectria hongkongensis]